MCTGREDPGREIPTKKQQLPLAVLDLCPYDPSAGIAGKDGQCGFLRRGHRMHSSDCCGLRAVGELQSGRAWNELLRPERSEELGQCGAPRL